MEAWREELHDNLYHSFKGQEWKRHKYIRKEGKRYIYPEDIKPSSKSQKGWVSDTVSSVGNAAATVGAVVSNAATSVGNTVSTAASNVADTVSDVWNNVANAVGNTATEAYNYVSSIVQNAIAQHVQEPSWPKQKGQSESHNQVGIAEKNNVPWNEKLNNYIKTRLAIIGDDNERLSDLYEAVSYLTYNHLNANGLLAKPATVSTPLHEGLDLASLAKAIDVDVSDLTEEDIATLTYALWGVLDAKIRGTKNPLIEGKGQIKDNLIDQIQGKPQQRQQLLNNVNSHKTEFVKRSASSTAKSGRSVVVKQSNKNLSHSDTDLYHHGIKGQKWYVRRYQNEDGSLTEEGKKRYRKTASKYEKQMDIYGHAIRRAQNDKRDYRKKQQAKYEAGKITESRMQELITKKNIELDKVEERFKRSYELAGRAFDLFTNDFYGAIPESKINAAKQMVKEYEKVNFQDRYESSIFYAYRVPLMLTAKLDPSGLTREITNNKIYYELGKRDAKESDKRFLKK